MIFIAPPRTRPSRESVERAVGLQLLIAAAVLEAALRLRPLPVLFAAGGRAARSPAARWFPAGRDRLTDARLDRLAVRAGAWWRGGSARSCLPRALLRSWLAATAGHDTAVVLGVRRELTAPFTAHAWLEVDGRVYGERADPEATFQRIARYPLATAREPAFPDRYSE